jgi:hypothetical protein
MKSIMQITGCLIAVVIMLIIAVRIHGRVELLYGFAALVIVAVTLDSYLRHRRSNK